MVTTTTKSLNYSITKGSNTNSVNATIVSTPGFNANYLGKVPGILKVLELLLAITALVLIAIERWQAPVAVPPFPSTAVDGKIPLTVSETFLVGEVYFLCAHSVVLAHLFILLVAYLFHTTSAMIVPKATTVENVGNVVLALLLLAAGIVEIVMVVKWRDHARSVPSLPQMDLPDQPIRFAAAALALLNGLLFVGSFVVSNKELNGPKTL